MFHITDQKINKEKLETLIENDKAGAIVTFDGRVRNHNEGHQVRSLEYQCYESMAIKVGLEIIQEAIAKFEVHEMIAVHRVGHLQIGDEAVVVCVSSSHRREAFEACQYIIDEVKLRVPIWKKEHYLDKEPEWVACHRCGHTHGEKEEHSHHHHK